MRKLLLSLFAAFAAFTSNAQTVVSTFDSLTLSGPDTFYVNLSSPGNDVGFYDGLAYFPTVYDTSFGFSYWFGWAYSNMTDSATSGYGNQYSAKTGIGVDSSANYVIASGANNMVRFTDSADARGVNGFYITNTTYAYNSMRDGDMFAKKFGGVSGSDSDWFKLEVNGYWQGVMKPTTVEFYLADFRDSNNANDYIVNTWEWVDLTSLGLVDSVSFTLTSTDTAFGFMNTPAYFAIDNFTVTPIYLAVPETEAAVAKIYPNPVSNVFTIELEHAGKVNAAYVYDMSGKMVSYTAITGNKTQVSLQALPAGTYMLQLIGADVKKGIRIVKQ